MSDTEASKWRLRVLLAMLGASLALVVGCSCPTRCHTAPGLGRVAVAVPASSMHPARGARPGAVPAPVDLRPSPTGPPIAPHTGPRMAAGGPTV